MVRAFKGEDIPISLTLLNSAGAAIAVESVDDVIIAIVHRQSSKVISRFALVSAEGYELIETVDGPEGEIRVIVPRTATASAPDGEYSLQIKIKSDAEGYPDDASHRMGEYPGVFHLSPTKLTTA